LFKADNKFGVLPDLMKELLKASHKVMHENKNDPVNGSILSCVDNELSDKLTNFVIN
jgi:hypothetical protein